MPFSSSVISIFLNLGRALARALRRLSRFAWAAGTLVLAVGLLLDGNPVRAEETVTVSVAGIEGPALENVQIALALPPGLVRNGAVDSRWLERFSHQIPDRVRRALEPFGYFSPVSDVVLVEQAPGNFLVAVTVTAGAPVRIGAFKVVLTGPGREEPRLLRKVARIPLHPGAVLRQDHYEQAKGELQSLALDLGYLNARFSRHRLSVVLEELRAEIDLELDTGPLFFFGSILIHGAPDYPDKFLKRYLAFTEGQRFDYSLMGQTQVNYLDSDRFRDVLVTPQIELAADQRVPVSIQLVPSDRRRIRPGVGYGTDTGPRMSLRYQDVNIFHRGNEFKVDTSLAQLKQSLTASYLIPSPRSLEDVTGFHFTLQREETDTYTSQTISTEVERIHSFGRGRLGSVFVRLLQEDYEVGLIDNRSRLILPGVRGSLQHFSDPIRPKSGFSIGLEARGTHPALVSDTELLQVLGNARFIFPLPGRLTVIGRGQGATTIQSDELAEIPPSLRFFAGGDQSVRGYDYQSLGPRDASGKVVGGKQLLTASIELERALGQNWGLAGFYDVGNAFNSLASLELAQGVGIGVRYYTMVGPIRIDLARQVGEPDPAFRLHISVGYSW
jgi:translocation and assembly module TamA